MATPPLDPAAIHPGDWRPVLAHLFERYAVIARDNQARVAGRVGAELAERAVRMCDHALVHLDAFTEDKASRWLGFVQGVLTVGGAIGVDTERDHTRPLFHALHGPAPTQEA